MSKFFEEADNASGSEPEAAEAEQLSEVAEK